MSITEKSTGTSAINGILARIQADPYVRQIDRSGWEFKRFTKPNDSCLPKLRIREFLRGLYPKDTGVFERISVYRHPETLYRPQIRYTVADQQSLTFDEAVAVLESLVLKSQADDQEGS